MSIVFATMVYDDEFFLDIWVKYYEKFVPRENLHIITHGPQEYAHEIAKGCKIIMADRDPENKNLDKDRFKFISNYCSNLTKEFERVVFNDVDEIVVLDPDCGDDLAEYILNIPKTKRTISGLGLEIIHRSDIEGQFDYSRAILSQRKYVRASGWYSKPNITNEEIIWGPDGHGSSAKTLNLDKNLFTFHLKWFDEGFHNKRHEDRISYWIKNEDGSMHSPGAGSWAWSQFSYRLNTLNFMRCAMAAEDDFDLGDYYERLENEFKSNHGPFKMSQSSFFVGGRIFLLPERFVGLF